MVGDVRSRRAASRRWLRGARGSLAVSLLVSFALGSVLAGCGRQDDSAGAQRVSPTPDSPVATPESARVRLTRLTPEQVSGVLKSRLGFETGWNDEQGFRDAIVRIFGVPLGGVDFETTLARDPLPKVHTILVTRTLAWNVAAAFTWWETSPAEAGKETRTRIMTRVDIAKDFPREAAASFRGVRDVESRDARWRAQLEDLYWRLFARPPRPEEIDACARAFARAMASQPWPPLGWQIVLFGLLSTAEFWNVWGEG